GCGPRGTARRVDSSSEAVLQPGIDEQALPEGVPAHCGLPVLLESRPLACVSRYEFHKPGPSCSNRRAVGALRRYLPREALQKWKRQAVHYLRSFGDRLDGQTVARGAARVGIAQFQHTLPCQKSRVAGHFGKRRLSKLPPVEDHDFGSELLGPQPNSARPVVGPHVIEVETIHIVVLLSRTYPNSTRVRWGPGQDRNRRDFTPPASTSVVSKDGVFPLTKKAVADTLCDGLYHGAPGRIRTPDHWTGRCWADLFSSIVDCIKSTATYLRRNWDGIRAWRRYEGIWHGCTGG